MRRISWLTLLLVVGLCPGCSQKQKQEQKPAGPRTRDQARALLRQAVQARDPGKVYDLLGQQSRWSVISIHKNLKQICLLVKAHYPQQRQARELERCAAAARARDARAYLAGLPWAGQLLRPLSASNPDPDKGLCQQDGAWCYCGLDPELGRLKVKSTRDLATTRENADAFGRQ